MLYMDINRRSFIPQYKHLNILIFILHSLYVYIWFVSQPKILILTNGKVVQRDVFRVFLRPMIFWSYIFSQKLEFSPARLPRYSSFKKKPLTSFSVLFRQMHLHYSELGSVFAKQCQKTAQGMFRFSLSLSLSSDLIAHFPNVFLSIDNCYAKTRGDLNNSVIFVKICETE